MNGPIDPQTGQRRKVRKTGFALKRDAVQACAVALASLNLEQPQVEPDRTVGEWLSEWIERREREGLRPATLAMYGRFIRRDIT